RHADNPAVRTSKRLDQFAGGGVPDSHGFIDTGRDDLSTVRAERHTIDHSYVSTEGERLAAVRGVPDLDRIALAIRGESLPIGAVGHVPHGVINGECLECSAGLHIPGLDLPVRFGPLGRTTRAARSQVSAVGAVRYPEDRA